MTRISGSTTASGVYAPVDTGSLDSITSQLEAVNNSINTLSTQVSCIGAQIAAQMNVVANAQSAVLAAERALAVAETDLSNAEAALAAWTPQRDASGRVINEGERERLRNAVTNARQNVQTAKTNLTNAKSTLRNAESTLSNLEQQKRSLETQLTNARANAEQLKRAIEAEKQRLERARAELANHGPAQYIGPELSRLDEQIAEQKAYLDEANRYLNTLDGMRDTLARAPHSINARPGETLAEIAAREHVSVDTLVALNPTLAARGAALGDERVSVPGSGTYAPGYSSSYSCVSGGAPTCILPISTEDGVDWETLAEMPPEERGRILATMGYPTTTPIEACGSPSLGADFRVDPELVAAASPAPGDPATVVRVPLDQLPIEVQERINAARALAISTGIGPGVSVTADGGVGVTLDGQLAYVDQASQTVAPFDPTAPSALSVFANVNMRDTAAVQQAYVAGLALAGRSDAQVYAPVIDPITGEPQPLSSQQVEKLMELGYQVAVFDPVHGTGGTRGANGAGGAMEDIQNIGHVPGAAPLYILLGGPPLDSVRREDIDALYISPARQEQLRAWAKNNVTSDRTVPADVSAVATLHALDGDTELGQLSAGEQHFLLDQAMQCWADPAQLAHGVNPDFATIETLVTRAANEPALGAVVADYFADLAIGSARGDLWAPETGLDPGLQTTFATYALMAANYGGGAGLNELVENIGPENVSAFVSALHLDCASRFVGDFYGCSTKWEQRCFLANQLLLATAQHPPTAASSVLVTAVFMTLDEAAYANDPYGSMMAESMATALCNMWFPDNPELRASETQRFGDLFADQEWRSLFVNDNLTPQTRLQCFNLFLNHPDWSVESLSAKGEGWENELVVESFALGAFSLYTVNAGNGDSVVVGDATNAYLQNIFYPGVAAADIPSGDDTPSHVVNDAILQQFGSGTHVEIEPIPVLYTANASGPVQLPLFRVFDPTTNTTRYFDNRGRAYTSLDHWAETNQLPPGRMAYPAPGDAPGTYELKIVNTPDTSDTFWEHVEDVTDVVALAGGIVAGTVLLVGVAPLSLPGLICLGVTGASSGWAVYKGVATLHDRDEHGQSIALTDPEAFPVWVDITANVLSIGAGGFGLAAEILGNSGRVNAALRATRCAVALNAGTVVTGSATTVIQLYDYLTQYRNMSAGAQMFALAQMVNSGIMTLVAAKEVAAYGIDAFRGGRSATSPIETPEYELPEYEQQWLAHVGDVDMDLDAHNMPWLSNEMGITPEHAIGLQHFADERGTMLIVRDSNPYSQNWYGDPTMQPKPHEILAKTAVVGPDAGLVVDPYNVRQQTAWEVAVAADPTLRSEWDTARRAWDASWPSMEAAGYRVNPDTGRVYLPRYNANGEPIGVEVAAYHGDLDLAAVYVEGSDGGYQHVNFGTGADADAPSADVFRMQLNDELEFSMALDNPMASSFRDALSGSGMEHLLPTQSYTPEQRAAAADKDFIQHGAQADYIEGPTYPGPVVVFEPGSSTPLRINTEPELRQFYADHHLPWPYGD